MRKSTLFIGFVVLGLCPPALEAKVLPPEIDLVAAEKCLTAPFAGRVFVIFSRTAIKEPPLRLNWFNPEPFFAQDVTGLGPGKPWRFRPQVGLPRPWDELVPGKYHLQAVLDRDLGGQNPLSAAGNLFSKPVEIELSATDRAKVTLVLDQVIAERTFEEKERVKLVDIPSGLLSKFHGKPMRLRAGVLLPKSYFADASRRYPVIYEVTGFGGDHHHVHRADVRNATDVAGVEMIHITLDATCRLGHHTFADSENNGPVGQALIAELIPHIDKVLRTVASPGGRFVTGHSSGGWSSLWLQITYPDVFGGCWSTAPDSVDFRDFQRVNIYEKGVNLLFDDKGHQRPLARKAGKPVLFYKPFSDMEVVFGRGGQLFSFEAVFSPKGKDGKPRPLYDRKTGLVDAATAAVWQNYDINLILRRDWDKLKDKLAGKIHIYMGGEDTFYLDGATRLLQKTLKEVGSDAVVEIFEGKDHGSVMTLDLRQRIAREMAAAVRVK
jgi:hypothetical protein